MKFSPIEVRDWLRGRSIHKFKFATQVVKFKKTYIQIFNTLLLQKWLFQILYNLFLKLILCSYHPRTFY